MRSCVSVGLVLLVGCSGPAPSAAPTAVLERAMEPGPPEASTETAPVEPIPAFDACVARLTTPLAELSDEALIAALVAGGWATSIAHHFALGAGPWGYRGRASQLELAVARDGLTGTIRLLRPTRGSYRSDRMDEVEASVAHGGYAVRREGRGVLGVLLDGHPAESAALLSALAGEHPAP